MCVLLAAFLLAVTHLAGLPLDDAASQGCQERFQLSIQILLMDSQVPVEQEEELLFHQVHFGAVETKAVRIRGEVRVVGPVLVLGRAVVEVLGG